VARDRSVLAVVLALTLAACDDSPEERHTPDSGDAAGHYDAGSAPQTDASVTDGRAAGVPDGPPGHRDARGAGQLDADIGAHPDADALSMPDAGTTDAGVVDGGTSARDAGRDSAVGDPGPTLLQVPGWSIRKRVHASRDDVLLEEVLGSFAEAQPGRTRIRKLPAAGAVERSFSMASGGYISDFCRHPSGAFSVIAVEADRTVSLARLAPDLTPLAVTELHDPEVVHDPHALASDGGPTDLTTNGFAWDAARIASSGEEVVATVDTTFNSIIAYRIAFTSGAWSRARRTMVEPPTAFTPFLPTGGSFDTFGAIVAWFRSMLDVDEDGNAYVAAYANRGRIRAHVAVFADDVKSIPADPNFPTVVDSDVLVTKLGPDGARVWTRVVGTPHEDEPYALRARFGTVAVAGRARRFPGFDNTAWDAFASVVSSDGTIAGTRVLVLEASGVFLAVDLLPGGGLVLGGSDGWSQNPDGLSVLSFGNKLLLELPALDGEPIRLPLAVGPRHNEIRTVFAETAHIRFGGHEDGPIMHTGDVDPSLIHATGVVGFVPSTGAGE
jgi:hypothetical protein